MKKLLALVLALVMTLSLCVTSNAAFDGEEFDYAEAVDVVSAVGVFQGDENGKFNAKENLTREQAAKLIAYLDLGKSVAEALPAVKVFNDVDASRWSAKYVAYCADAGYIAGVGNGNFNPTGELTGYAFGKMLLCALGFDATIEGFTGASWTIKVAKLMESNKIAKSVSTSPAAVLTREEAAQYCFNALKACCVAYDDNQTITIGNVEIKQSSKAHTYGGDYAAKITDEDDGPFVQLGEKLYKGDLQLAGVASVDAFNSPAHGWLYKKSEVGTYADDAVATFTASTKAAAVAEALVGYKTYPTNPDDASSAKKIENVTKYNVSLTTNTLNGLTATTGDVETIAAAIADETANGRLVKVFANDDNQVTKIVVVNYINAQVTKVSTDKVGTTTYTLKDLAAGTTATFKDYEKENLSDTISFATAPAKDDYVTYVVGTDGVAYVYATELVEGAVTYAKDNSKLTIGGTTYESNKAYDDRSDSASNFGTTKSTQVAKVYVDQYGFVAAYKGPSSTGDKTVAVTNVYNTLVDGKIVAMVDGVVSSGEVKTFKKGTGSVSEGKLYTYKDNATDSTKTDFTQVTDADVYYDLGIGVAKNDKVVYVGATGFAANEKKVDVDTRSGIGYVTNAYFTSDVKVINITSDGKYTVATGMIKIDTKDTFVVLKTVDGDDTLYVDCIYVLGASVASSATAEDLIFVKAATPAKVSKTVDGEDKVFYEYTAYGTDGEKIADFYAKQETLAANAFYSKDVETASGAYDLSDGNKYTTTDEALSAVADIEISHKVNGQNIVSYLGYDLDLSDAVIKDTRSSTAMKTIPEITDIDDFNDTLDLANVDAIEVSVVYNYKTGDASCLFITDTLDY